MSTMTEKMAALTGGAAVDVKGLINAPTSAPADTGGGTVTQDRPMEEQTTLG